MNFFVRDPEPIPEPAPPRARTEAEPAEGLKVEPAAGDTSAGQGAPVAKAAQAASADAGWRRYAALIAPARLFDLFEETMARGDAFPRPL